MSSKEINNKYIWQVIHDPTKSKYSPGLFYHHLFRKSDVFLLSNETVNYWPEGIVFKNITTGEIVKFHNGKLYESKAG